MPLRSKPDERTPRSPLPVRGGERRGLVLAAGDARDAVARRRRGRAGVARCRGLGRFLAQHDLVWKRVPAKWEEGAFLGNGLLGAMVFGDGQACLAWQLGRTDVTDHRKGREAILARPRLPIGRLRLETAGELAGADARLGLHDAELGGRFTTTKGALRVQSYVHATLPVILVELAPSGGERDARFVFQPALPLNERLLARQVPLTEGDLNPAPFVIDKGTQCASRSSGARPGANTRWPGRKSAWRAGGACWCSASPTRSPRPPPGAKPPPP